MAPSTLLVCGGLTVYQDDTDIKVTPVTASATATIPAGPESFYNQKVFWYICDKKEMGEATSGKDVGLTRAKVKVPLDHDDSGGETVGTAVKKWVVSGDFAGSLFVNLGEPGGSGIELVEGAGSYFSKNLISSYDVVGFSPRSVGASTAVDRLTDAELDTERTGMNDPATPSVATIQERAQRMGEACTSKTDPAGLLDHIDTISAAKGLDILQAVDGQQTLAYLGFSYGACLGATYTELFPADTGRLVLDGAVNPFLSAASLALGQAKGFEASLRAYVQNCQSSKLGYPLSGDVDSRVSQVRKFLEFTKAVPLLTSDDKRPPTCNLAIYGVLGLIYQTQLRPFPTLVPSQAIGKTGTLNGSASLAIADVVSFRQSGDSCSGSDAEALMAANCLNYPVQGNNTFWKGEARAVNEASPVLGSQLLCLNAYYQGQGHTPSRKREKITAFDAVPVLMVGTTDDPATPYAWSEALADQLKSGQFTTWKGNGRIAHGRSSDCVRKAVGIYLLNETIPVKELTR